MKGRIVIAIVISIIRSSVIVAAATTTSAAAAVGVGARDLKECLLIQLDRMGKSESVESVIVNLHIDDLGRRR